MGLLDQILGSVFGSRSGTAPPQQAGSSMSPLTKALLLLLAAKAYQHYRSRPAQAPGGQMPYDQGRFGPQQGPGGGMGSAFPGGLGGALGGGLGGLLGGLAGAGGLGALVDRFRDAGYGGQVDSWVGRGQNQRIGPDDMARALGADTLDELEQQTGMPRDQMLSELSDVLPEAIDDMTPDGRLPTEDELQRWG
jgi:uncharacterized protein YidB (DUF937 family)